MDGEVYQRDTIAGGDTVVAIDPKKEGYVFSGWEGLPARMPAEDVTATGLFLVKVKTTGLDDYNNDAICVWASNKTIFIQTDRNTSYVVYNMLGYIVDQGDATMGL